MVLISFSGIDGSGKTTQINLLINYLNKKKIPYRYVHLFSKDNSFSLKLQSRKLFSSLINRIRSLSDNRISNFIKLYLRLLNLLIDSWITFLSNKLNYPGKFIIFDRYYYDILIMILLDYPKYRRFIIYFAILIPKPDIIFFFKVNPSTSLKRKKDLSIDSAKNQAQLFSKLCKLLNIRPIDAEQKKYEILSKIKKRISLFQNE